MKTLTSTALIFSGDMLLSQTKTISAPVSYNYFCTETIPHAWKYRAMGLNYLYTIPNHEFKSKKILAS